MSHVAVENIVKQYKNGDGKIKAVDNLSFSVDKGNIFTILGPSGCGKTTTLRCLAGLETVESGRICIGGNTVSDAGSGIALKPDERDIGLMHQSYALWPHMTVESNIKYALKGRGYQGNNKERVDKVLELIDMPNMSNRYPSELSGGQQQRVAFARAVAYNPNLLLLDEPLSSLDLNQRRKMRTRLREMLNTVGITTIYVTHDQEEAFEISDKILIMNNGQRIQAGSPERLYHKPISSFVANFLGEANILDVEFEDDHPTKWAVQSGDTSVSLRSDCDDSTDWENPVAFVHSEDIKFTDGKVDEYGNSNVFSGIIKQKHFRGRVTLYMVNIGDVQLKIKDKEPSYEVGQQVGVRIPIESVSIIEK